MHIRIIFLLCFSFLNLFGEIENAEFIADKIVKNNGIISATGNVLLYSQNYFISANRANYDEENKIVELFGDVNLIRQNNEASHSNYARIDLKTNEIDLSDAFAVNKNKEVWIQSAKGCSDNEYYSVTSSIVSSCNVQDPDWHISFSSGKLNKKTKFVHVFNPVFYLGKVPVFYLPYFGFSIDESRRSGFLTPQIGYSNDNGFFYAQPIYIATAPQWDFELLPQIRTKRGTGIYNILRFSDSSHSNGEISFGFFRDKKSYQEKEYLKNQIHNGAEIQYSRDKLAKYLVNGDYAEGLWFKYAFANDIDYLNLRDRSYRYDSLVASKLNYFINTDSNFWAIYAKYFIDTTKLGTQYENKTTIQELPTLHYHKSLDNVYSKNFTYSIDAKYHNYTRQIGTSASQYEINVPIGFNVDLFDDYANLSLTENFYATRIEYNNNTYQMNDKYYGSKHNNYFRYYHDLRLQTNLARSFDKFLHTMNFSLEYTKPQLVAGKIDDNVLKRYLINEQKGEVFFEDNFLDDLDDKLTQENVKFGFSQYFYDKSGDKFLKHSMTQNYSISDRSFLNLENTINLYLGKFTISNKLEYSYLNKIYPKIQTGIGYSDDNINISLYHTYKKNILNNVDYDTQSYFGSSYSFKLPGNYRLFGNFDYDIKKQHSKMWSIGIEYRRKCWNYSLSYKEDVEPKNILNGVEKKIFQGFYLKFSFYPFGGISYNYSLKDSQW